MPDQVLKTRIYMISPSILATAVALFSPSSFFRDSFSNLHRDAQWSHECTLLALLATFRCFDFIINLRMRSTYADTLILDIEPRNCRLVFRVPWQHLACLVCLFLQKPAALSCTHRRQPTNFLIPSTQRAHQRPLQVPRKSVTYLFSVVSLSISLRRFASFWLPSDVASAAFAAISFNLS